MDPRELRIGNIIEFRLWPDLSDWFGSITEVRETQAKMDIKGISTPLTAPWLECKPVPVTEGLLKAIGFTSEGYTEGCMGYGHFFSAFVLELHVGEWCWVFTDGGREFRRAIKYLHELQNLFFILGGEEFPINITDIQ